MSKMKASLILQLVLAAWITLESVSSEKTDIITENVIEKLDDLSRQQSKTNEDLRNLKVQNTALSATVARQERHILTLQREILVQKQEVARTKVELEKQKHNLRNVTSLLMDAQITKRQRRSGSPGVAFTVYLDHDITLGDYRVVKFNKVILNEGNGYNIYTGLFTCPKSGIYLFSFSIGEKGIAGTQIRLLKNGNNTIDGAVDTFNDLQDLQASTSAVLRCNQGDSIWIEASGDHLEGSTDLRLTTFTGVFLYE